VKGKWALDSKSHGFWRNSWGRLQSVPTLPWVIIDDKFLNSHTYCILIPGTSSTLYREFWRGWYCSPSDFPFVPDCNLLGYQYFCFAACNHLQELWFAAEGDHFWKTNLVGTIRYTVLKTHTVHQFLQKNWVYFSCIGSLIIYRHCFCLEKSYIYVMLSSTTVLLGGRCTMLDIEVFMHFRVGLFLACSTWQIYSGNWQSSLITKLPFCCAFLTLNADSTIGVLLDSGW
jgi:hypothetical protein